MVRVTRRHPRRCLRCRVKMWRPIAWRLPPIFEMAPGRLHVTSRSATTEADQLSRKTTMSESHASVAEQLKAVLPKGAIEREASSPTATGRRMRISSLATALMLCPLLAAAELTVTVLPVKATGSKAVVPLRMKNGFAEKSESARAVCFLLDDQGKVVGRETQWVIGGGRDKSPLAARATNAFNFVVTASKPLTATNLTARVSFSRIIRDGGKLADVAKQVTVTLAEE